MTPTSQKNKDQDSQVMMHNWNFIISFPLHVEKKKIQERKDRFQKLSIQNSNILIAKKKTSTAKCDSIPETQLFIPLIPFLITSQQIQLESDL